MCAADVDSQSIMHMMHVGYGRHKLVSGSERYLFAEGSGSRPVLKATNGQD
jgi:hypothetical protein